MSSRSKVKLSEVKLPGQRGDSRWDLFRAQTTYPGLVFVRSKAPSLSRPFEDCAARNAAVIPPPKFWTCTYHINKWTFLPKGMFPVLCLIALR